MVQGQTKQAEKKHDVPQKRVISDEFAIEILDLKTKEKTKSAVLSQFGNTAVTEEMLKQQVSDLNRNCGLHGGTAQATSRHLVFKLITLH